MAGTQKPIAKPEQGRAGQTAFVVVAGFFFFVSIIKFGDPVILQDVVQPPKTAAEVLFESWPIKWGYWMLIPFLLAGLAAVRWKEIRFRWPLVLPVLWLGWQLVSATQSVGPKLTSMTMEHFTACFTLFCLGYFCLRGDGVRWPLWTCLALALCWILRAGFDQHFGGLEATRKFMALYKDGTGLPAGELSSPSYIKRIQSDRVFATFSSPDGLAAAIELLLPLTLLFLWQITSKVRPSARWAFVAILGGCGLACLYWTGSKGGWLVALLMAVIILGRSNISPNWKRGAIALLLVLGIVGIAVRYTSNQKKEQASVGTRMAYWRAAVQIASQHPLIGTGPGTFEIAFRQVKRPEDDFSRLCHNDYLQQACDSGIPGFLAYVAMVFCSMVLLYRYRCLGRHGTDCNFMLWLGLLGLCLHCLIDYHLYVPALSWPMFFFLGFGANSKN